MTATRYANVSEKEHCPYCCDVGWVLVGWSRVGTEEQGPCPHCEQGFAIEFPEGKRRGPWGENGYWRGRPTAGIERRCSHGVTPVPPPAEFLAVRDRLVEAVEDRELAESLRRGSELPAE